jgi:hypothetical protein
VLDPLATQADAVTFGYALPAGTADAFLARASARVRRAAGQPITPSVVTLQLTPESRRVELPAPPVIEVQSVSTVDEDGTATALTGWWFDGTYLRLPHHQHAHCRTDLKVAYRRGWEVLSAGLVELVCQVAHRLSVTPVGMDAGIRQQAIDDYSITFASETMQVAGDLLPGELTALRAELGERTVWVVSTS